MTKFTEVAAGTDDESLIRRENPLYERTREIRNPFVRDYTRVLHSGAFRRLKHKTQVFFNIANDHICTRMEHVLHVESVSANIASALGLNSDLTRAIALAHDLGHAPFGHQGETAIARLSREYLGEAFTHERHGLRTVDKLELLEDNREINRNLNLTYAVRDGIVSHCGEIDENNLVPRKERGDLGMFSEEQPAQPSTWEGCVVKISDKIAYLGRDIEDAVNLGFLTEDSRKRLRKIAGNINTTVIMYNMINDICDNSDPGKGIALSREGVEQLDEIKRFNYEHIYKNPRFEPYKAYCGLVLTQLFEYLKPFYDGENTIAGLRESVESPHNPKFLRNFYEWLPKFCEGETVRRYENAKLYSLANERDYIRAILDFISGMTDRYAVDCFNELITYS
ncbi:deoxyguanosinetriphosphate triphosphohydrolase-like protein [Clostridia bacterium]|nr:deoxyguanosinetriphosphate triphosphohydrolase-like protein [Clostridia bacterium]